MSEEKKAKDKKKPWQLATTPKDTTFHTPKDIISRPLLVFTKQVYVEKPLTKFLKNNLLIKYKLLIIRGKKKETPRRISY